MVVRCLPPLTAVRAFEVVGRRLSITLAGRELFVAPGAVCRQIRALEDALGVQLLVRGHRQVILTPAGEGYHCVVTKAIEMLTEATARVSGHTKRTRLEVRVSPSTRSTSARTTSTVPSGSATATGRTPERSG